MCRSRRELSNECLLAKVGVDTAENEPCKVCPLSAYRSPRYMVIALDRVEAEKLEKEPVFVYERESTRMGNVGTSYYPGGKECQLWFGERQRVF